MDISGKNIIITGASSGIGKTCAIECSKAGADVHIVGRHQTTLFDTYEQLEGCRNTYHICDLSDYISLAGLIEDIVNKSGKIDGFIHSAGFQISLPIKNISPTHYHNIMQVNVVSAFEISRLLSRKNNYPITGLSIIFISSIMSVVGDTALTAYCASKAALLGGMRAMAIELAPKKIRVNCVSPGIIEDTLMTENGKNTLSSDEFNLLVKKHPLGLGNTQDVSSMCIYLLSKHARWITGQNFIVDGGYTAS